MASILSDEGFQYVALDLDPVRVRGAWEAGQPVFYANAIHLEILDAAGLRNAAALLVSFDDAEGALKIVRVVRSVRQDLPLLVSTRDATHLDQLMEATEAALPLASVAV
jgi:CPA2 family monovalent cation:H+ antiporter-2